MIINKNNQNIVGLGELNFHDFYITSFVFNLLEKEIKIIISNSHLDWFCLNFKNVFDFLYTSRNSDGTIYYDIVLGWGAIPNDYSKDNFLEEIKNIYISNGGEWNNELFAVGFCLNNMSEIKIICERIIIEKILSV